MSENNPSEFTNPDPKESKKFSIEKALRGDYTLLEYSYRNEKDPTSIEKQFTIRLKSIDKYDPDSRLPKLPKPDKTSKESDRYRIITNIFDSDDKAVGRLTGDIIKEGDEYYALYMENTSDQEGEVEYPGLITTTITQLVKQEVFLAWYGSFIQNSFGTATYKRIVRRGELEVDEIILPNGKKRYKLTKKRDKKEGK